MFSVRKSLCFVVISSACLFQLDAMESKEAVRPKSATIEKSEFLELLTRQKIALQSSEALKYLEVYVIVHADNEYQARSCLQTCLQELIRNGFDVNHTVGDDCDNIPMNALGWFVNRALFFKSKLQENGDSETAQSDFKAYVEEYVAAALRVLLEHRADPEYQLIRNDGTEIISPLVYACKIFYDTHCDESFMPVLELLASYSSGQQVDLLAQFMSEYKASPDDPKKSKIFSNAIRTLQNVKKVVLQKPQVQTPQTQAVESRIKVFEVSPRSAFSRVSSSKTLSSDASQLSRVSLLSTSSSSSSLSSVSLQDTPVEVPLEECKESVSPSERVRSMSVLNIYTGDRTSHCRSRSVPAIVYGYGHAS